MLDIVKCKVLSVIEGSHVDAYPAQRVVHVCLPSQAHPQDLWYHHPSARLEKLLTIAAKALAGLNTSASFVKLAVAESDASASADAKSDDESLDNDEATTAMSDSSFIHERQLGSLVKACLLQPKELHVPRTSEGPSPRLDGSRWPSSTAFSTTALPTRSAR